MVKLKPIPNLDESTTKRFWNKVPKNVPDDECWNWLGSIIPSKQNRAIFHVGSQKQQKIYIAARVMWFMTYNDDPQEMGVLHHCDNPQCVNPKHLYKGTMQDNANDRVSRGRGTKGQPAHPNTVRACTGDNHYLRKHPEKRRRGEQNFTSKLTAEQVLQIRKERKDYSLNKLAAKYGVSKKLILNIVKGKAWTHLPLTP